MAYNPKQRTAAIAKVIDGLRNGIPLTVICSEDGMPCDDTVRNWADGDDELSRDIARARDAGFDKIALDALRIADTPVEGKRIKQSGDEIEEVTEDMLGHRKLQVETRLKLLSKWDPKRYGELIKHGNADGSNIDLTDRLSVARERALRAD